MNCIVKLKSVCKLEFKALPEYLLFKEMFQFDEPKRNFGNLVEIKLKTYTLNDF